MKLITDRTIEDVRAGNAKGYYTYGDLNRVERQVQMLTQLAKQADMHLELQICTDWGRGGLRRKVSLRRCRPGWERISG